MVDFSLPDKGFFDEMFDFRFAKQANMQKLLPFCATFCSFTSLFKQNERNKMFHEIRKIKHYVKWQNSETFCKTMKHFATHIINEGQIS